MIKAIADRLAEAFAEQLHEQVRQNIWGYAENEKMEAADLHKIKYQVCSSQQNSFSVRAHNLCDLYHSAPLSLCSSPPPLLLSF